VADVLEKPEATPCFASITTPRAGTPASTTLSAVGSRWRSKARIGTIRQSALTGEQLAALLNLIQHYSL